MNQVKQVLVLIAGREGSAASGGSKNELHVDIVPGVTAKDLLRKIGMRKGHLKKSGGGYLFGENEELYPQVETGDKLIAVPNTPVARR